MKTFNLYQTVDWLPQYTRVVIIPARVGYKKDLLQLFCHQLEFPSYFAYSLDALYDCLTDLAWISEKNVVIIHHDIPLRNDDSQRRYLKMLLEAINQEENHCLEVGFPRSCASEISFLLQPKVRRYSGLLYGR